MKIGVGISTTPNRSIHENVYKYKDPSTDIFVFNDSDRKGVSFSRNTLLTLMKDYDHIFLMDDDVYPMMHGWEKYFIEQCAQHDVHYSSLPEAFKSKLLSVDGEMGRWDNGIGAFTYQTKHALEVIGGYNTAYNRYGFEDTGRSFRARRAGLSGGEFNSCPIRSLAYIHSMDVFGESPTANLTFDEKMDLINLNRIEFEKEVQSDQLFYAYA